MQILQKIKALREYRNLTQERFAKMLGMSVSGYKKLELGINKDIGLLTLEKIAIALDTTVPILTEYSNDFIEPNSTVYLQSQMIERLQKEVWKYKMQALIAQYSIEKIKKPMFYPPQSTMSTIVYIANVIEDIETRLQKIRAVRKKLEKTKLLFDSLQVQNKQVKMPPYIPTLQINTVLQK
jgi:transcriptional regulator with XRE-family HTH domain